MFKKINLIVPFINRCSLFSHAGNDESSPLKEMGVTGMIRIDNYYGFTGLHAIKNGLMNTDKEGRKVAIFTVDRYFLGKGFRPQLLCGVSDDKDNPECLNFMILDGNQVLTGDEKIMKDML